MKYTVVAYKTTRYEMEVEAASAEEARNKADTLECISDKWEEDFEYFDFSITDVRKIDSSNIADLISEYANKL